MKKYTKGFTLIELLTVIAIIAILSSIILVSLGTARKKSNDTKIRSDLTNIRSVAENLYTAVGSYGTSDPENSGCPSTPSSSLTGDTAVQTYINDIKTVLGATVKCGVKQNTRDSYAIIASMEVGGTGDYWCVDSVGASNLVAIDHIGDVTRYDYSCIVMDSR